MPWFSLSSRVFIFYVLHLTWQFTHLPHWGRPPQTPGVYPPEDTGEVEKQRISPAALHRISCSRVGSLSSVALFCCIFSFGTFFGIIRVYTVVFSDPFLRIIAYEELDRGILKTEYGERILFWLLQLSYKQRRLGDNLRFIVALIK